jgi:hypothetical protein
LSDIPNTSVPESIIEQNDAEKDFPSHSGTIKAESTATEVNGTKKTKDDI